MKIDSITSILTQNTARASDAVNERTSSPYLRDQPGFNPTRLKGTQEEREWKIVTNSQQDTLDKMATQDRAEKIQIVQDLKKKLNII